MTIQKISGQVPRSEVHHDLSGWAFPAERRKVRRTVHRNGRAANLVNTRRSFWSETPIVFVKIAIFTAGVILTVLAGFSAPWLAQLIDQLLS